MTLRKLIPALAFLAVFAMAARISVDTDTWWHLRAGQWILENGTVPQVDPFSYTRLGASWQYPGWMVEVPMYWIYRATGPGGLNLWTGAMVALAFFFVWKTLTGNVFIRSFAIIFAATASGVYWAARPYLVTFVWTAVFLWLLEEDRKNRPDSGRILWLLPLLMVVWANSHGGFAAGFLLWGVYFADRLFITATGNLYRLRDGSSKKDFLIQVFRETRRYIGVGALMLVAVCLNPSGPVMLAYPFKTIGIAALQDYIAEWQPPDFHQLHVQPFLWLLLVTFGVIGASRKRLALSDFLLFAGFAYMGFMAGRNIALFALAAPMVLTRHLAPLLETVQRKADIPISLQLDGRSRGALVMNTILLLVLGSAVLLKAALVYPASVNQEFFSETLPVEAVSYLKTEKPAGRLFNPYNWGGYLVWALPEYPVFVDGRTDLYDDEIIQQWLKVSRAEAGWQGVVDEYGIELVLSESGSVLVQTLESQPGWNILYQDSLAVIYQRGVIKSQNP